MSNPQGHFPRRASLPDPYAPCSDETLAASTRNIANLADESYWAALCPELTVGGQHPQIKPLKNAALEADAKQQIIDEGVFQAGAQDINWFVDVHCLARNMAVLMQYGWPATFLLMYDEVWALIHRVSQLMVASSGGNACNMDVLCWYVDPNRGDTGFSPHRDRQPDDSPATFRPDGSAMYSTCWVPLTDACPENSCLYMVPRWADPGYYPGDDDDGPDPLSVALSSKEAYQSIRAFPAEAGSVIIFTHRTIHWGSRGRKGYHTPRLAVSWGCADDAYEPAYFSREHLPYPPMELRAALACGQMLAYHERFPMTRRQLSLYFKFFNTHADEFDKAYRAKVSSEFLAASKELVPDGPGEGLAVAALPGATSSGDDVKLKGHGDCKGPDKMGKKGKGEKPEGKTAKNKTEDKEDKGTKHKEKEKAATKVGLEVEGKKGDSSTKKQSKKRDAKEGVIGNIVGGGGGCGDGGQSPSAKDAKPAKKAKKGITPQGDKAPAERIAVTGGKDKRERVEAPVLALMPAALVPARKEEQGKGAKKGAKQEAKKGKVCVATSVDAFDDSGDELIEDMLEAMLDAEALWEDMGHDDYQD